jgi:GTP-binding protein EngB required for normal cell division
MHYKASSPQHIKMDIAMNDFQSKDHRDLLDIIDQLRSQGFSRYIDLPQIIVCGDQSAGKSSVLEAISGMSFPTKDNLCTQFATELILRRHSEKSIKISITPGDDRDPEEKDALLGWRPSFNLDRDGLEAIVEEAKSEMGLSTTRRFCNDILRVELSGPTQPHLTMVDLPGLFKTGNKDQSADNVALVRDMVARYMNRPRSIILAVLSAKNEYVLQEVPSLAKKADPEGLRTIGLITKPDTLDAGSDSERSWVQLAMNKDVELTLGWHVLKNRSYDQKHFTSAERDAAEEEFFSQGIWARLDPSCCMVKNLKHHLSSVLKKQILDQLPSLVHDVEIGIEDCSAKLARLGDTRESPEQQLRYLSGVSQRFSKLMTEATQGIYNDVFFGSPKGVHDYTKRLRAIIQNRLSDFAKEMREFGQSQVITESDGDETYGSRSISRSDYIDHVKIMMSRNRGRELPGLFNPDVINDLFTQQCRPWRRIAVEMTRDIFERVCRAAESIIRHSTADDAADEIVLLVKAEIGDYKTSMDAKVNELLQLHDVLHAITYNPQLTINVQTARRERRRVAMARRVSEIFGTRGFSDVDTKVTINPAQITELLLDEIELDMGRYGTSIAVDYMQAYYAVS